MKENEQNIYRKYGNIWINNNTAKFIVIFYFLTIIWALLLYYYTTIQIDEESINETFTSIFSVIYSIVLITIISILIRKKVLWRNQLALGSFGFWIVCLSIIASIIGEGSLTENLIIFAFGIILTTFLYYYGKINPAVERKQEII